MQYAAIIAVVGVSLVAGLALGLVVAALCGAWIDQQLVASIICSI